MLSASCSVTVVVLLITVCKTNGDSVTQTEGLVILSEGSSLTLNCNYQADSYSEFLFWYVQYLHEGPQLLLKSTTENQRMEHHGFHATLVKKDSSFHLHKSSLQLSDSAVYYCALRDTVRGTTGEVEHKPRGSGALE
uniref:Ig-like domain-containing protein n=1 Tax=Oryctolagus cuniculus TaxID=9986 RepID=G1TXX5_RABIT